MKGGAPHGRACRSTIRCSYSSAPARPALRNASFTAPAAPCSSMSRSIDYTAIYAARTGCFFLGNPNLPAYSAECQCSSLGLDVRALAPDGAHTHGIGELVCANPFPSRPVKLLHDPGGVLYHDTYFGQNPGYWTHGDLIE